jgi:hypothetical protein
LDATHAGMVWPSRPLQGKARAGGSTAALHRQAAAGIEPAAAWQSLWGELLRNST